MIKCVFDLIYYRLVTVTESTENFKINQSYHDVKYDGKTRAVVLFTYFLTVKDSWVKWIAICRFNLLNQN